jgi:hypothetical protein
MLLCHLYSCLTPTPTATGAQATSGVRIRQKSSFALFVAPKSAKIPEITQLNELETDWVAKN